MSFQASDLDYDTGGGFGQFEATITDAGACMSKFGPAIFVIATPTNPKRFEQHLSMGIGKGDYVFAGNPRTIETGRGEKAFSTTIYDKIESGPKIKILSNGGLFLNALKHLGFELSGGDITSCIGLKLDLEEVDANAVIEQFNKEHPKSVLPERTGEYAGKITMPVKIIEIPAKKIPLNEQVLNFISVEKTENEVIAWCTESGASKKDVFANLDSEIEGGHIVFDGKTYMVKAKNE